jgi:hypothetical protein
MHAPEMRCLRHRIKQISLMAAPAFRSIKVQLHFAESIRDRPLAAHIPHRTDDRSRRIWPGARFDAAIGRSGVSYNGVSGTAAASFPGNRWLASTGFTGMYRTRWFEIEPSAKVYAIWERDSSYIDSTRMDAAITVAPCRGSLKSRFSEIVARFDSRLDDSAIGADWVVTPLSGALLWR